MANQPGSIEINHKYYGITDLLNLIFSENSPGISVKIIAGTTDGKTNVARVFNNYQDDPVTTSAYVELIAQMPADVNNVYIYDSSGQALVLAFGAEGEEEDQQIIVPGGNGLVSLFIPKDTRLSIKALTDDADQPNSYLIMNLNK